MTSDDEESQVFLNEAIEFRTNLQSIDSIQQAERQRQYEERYQSKYGKKSSETKAFKQEYSLFPFDPNSADSATFVRLGIKPYVASSILKYRNKGGKFRKSDDFAKIYGLSPDKFTELEPYINIVLPKDSVKQQATKITETIEVFVVELNSADTTELMRIKGIGRFYARGIVRLRNELGGFVSVKQLQEVYGMRPENYERIAPFCTVEVGALQKININTASIDRLKRHPYLDFYQSKAIYELRRKKGKLKSIDDLRSLKELTSENLSKIEPYLNFD